MSVVREENKCTITFDDDTWHDGVSDVYTITDGTYSFVVSNTFTYDDKTTLCSASITHNQASQTSFNVKYVQDGTLKLNVCVSSESNYDFMRVYIDSVEKVKISGVISFKDYEFDMTAGDHVVLLEYKKDGLITGLGANVFKLAGSVLLYGIISAFILTVIKVVLHG